MDNRLEEFFNTMVSQAKNVTRNVADKANETVENAKISFAIKNTEAKIAECKEQIGDILFREYLKKKDFEGEIGELCRRIENYAEDIEVMRDKQMEIKNNIRCRACGKTNNEKNTFCSECGEKLYYDYEEEN